MIIIDCTKKNCIIKNYPFDVCVGHNYNSVLVLSDGMVLYGHAIGAGGQTCGEVCFTTGMTGYQHTITDPSFAKQIINFTFPHIGNIGINEYDSEREKIYASGVIIRNDISSPSHYTSVSHLDTWMKENGIIGISNIDTRALTIHLRDNGSCNGLIFNHDYGFHPDIDELLQTAKQIPSIANMELSQYVTSNKSINSINEINHINTVVIIDFGAKNGIIHSLKKYNVKIITLPVCNNLYDKILSLNPDGIILSNGPGDPEATSELITDDMQKILSSNIPIFGICLGHQILGIALGAKTTKMNHGHRGANHPIKNLQSGEIEITSQNHGFTICKNSIPDNIEITHISLFDKTIAGIKVKNKPIFSVQYHPEGSPGPNDSKYLFSQFMDCITS